ncbi:unnamed protein product [Lampetra planeri]
MVDNTEMEELEVVEEELEVLQPHPKQLLGELSREVTRTATINRPVRTPLVSKSPEDGSGMPRNERIFFGSYPLHEAIATHDPTLVDFVSSCLRTRSLSASPLADGVSERGKALLVEPVTWDLAERPTPEQALANSWLQEPGSAICRTTTTTTTTTMTTTVITTTMTITAITTTTTMLPSLAMTSDEQEDKEMVEQEMEAVEQEAEAVCKKKRSHLACVSKAIRSFFCRVLLCGG